MSQDKAEDEKEKLERVAMKTSKVIKEKLIIPKVKFEYYEIKKDIELIKNFTNSENTKWYFKDLISMSGNLDDNIKKLVNYTYTLKEFVDAKKVEDDWKNWGIEYLNILTEVLETDWGFIKRIKGFVSACWVCPRFLRDNSFCVYYKKSLIDKRKTIAHEIFHFLYFKKWGESIYSTDEFNTLDKAKEYNDPSLVWHLSEILVGIIMNDPRIKNITNVSASTYEEYRNEKINDETIVMHFVNLYVKSRKEEKSVAEFLKEAYNYAKKYEEIIINANKNYHSKALK